MRLVIPVMLIENSCPNSRRPHFWFDSEYKQHKSVISLLPPMEPSANKQTRGYVIPCFKRHNFFKVMGILPRGCFRCAIYSPMFGFYFPDHFWRWCLRSVSGDRGAWSINWYEKGNSTFSSLAVVCENPPPHWEINYTTTWHRLQMKGFTFY